MDGARTLIRNGLAQNDVDMANHKLLNLDTSNLPPSGLPPTVHPPTNKWLHDWDTGTRQWAYTQPSFSSLAGVLSLEQQGHITALGTIRTGTWQGSVIAALYLPALDSIRAPVGNLSIANKRITNLADPVNATDAVNRRYMDMLLTGLNPKESVRVASTVNIDFNDPMGTSTVDGVTLAPNDRVLAKDQNDTAKNGIWIHVADDNWTRATDCDHGTNDAGFNAANSINAAYCFVNEGDTQAGTSWVQIQSVIHINDNPVRFVLFSSEGIIAGNGLERVGSTLNALGTTNRILVGATIDIDPNYAGQATITTLGIITTGEWQGTVVDPAFGGTGINNGAHTITLAGALSTSAAGDASLQLTLIGPTVVNVPQAGTLATLEGEEELSNKRMILRENELPSNAHPTINTDTTDVFYITALLENALITASGTPNDGDKLNLFIKDNGTSRTLTWDTQWVASTDLPLPTATISGKWLFMDFIWHGKLSKWLLKTKLENI